MINWIPGIKLEVMERMIIMKAVEFYRGNRQQTADSLGISVKTLYNKLELYDEQDAAKKIKSDEREKEAREIAMRGRPAHSQPVLKSSEENDVSVSDEKIVHKQHAPLPSRRHPEKTQKR